MITSYKITTDQVLTTPLNPWEYKKTLETYIEGGSNKAESEAIKDLIRCDQETKQKELAEMAKEYYECENRTILNTDFNKYTYRKNLKDKNGVDNGEFVQITVESDAATNKKSISSFFPTIVKQKVNRIEKIEYFVDDPDNSEDAELLKLFNEYHTTKFQRDIKDFLITVSKNGQGCAIYSYSKPKDGEIIAPKDNKIKRSFIKDIGIIPLNDLNDKSKLVGLIRYYTTSVIVDGKSVDRTAVEFYNELGIEVWKQDEDKNYYFDSYSNYLNYEKVIDENNKEATPYNLDFIPIAMMYNNDLSVSDLQPMLNPIDEYDFLMSLTVNDIAALKNALIAIKGTNATSSEELANHINLFRVIAGENVEAKAITIPLEDDARRNQIKEVKDNVFRAGGGVDYYNENFRSATTGEALKRILTGLLEKVYNFSSQLDAFLEQDRGIVVSDINRRTGKNYNPDIIKWNVRIKIEANEKEIAERLALQKTAGILSLERTLEINPDVNDPAKELERLEPTLDDSDDEV